jgi:hypothetical protein
LPILSGGNRREEKKRWRHVGVTKNARDTLHHSNLPNNVSQIADVEQSIQPSQIAQTNDKIMRKNLKDIRYREIY